jgi:hypothetical protein
MTILIRLGDAAGVDAAVSVYERSNLARHQGVWPNRSAGAERVRAHLREPDTWFILAYDGPALVGMASVTLLHGEGGTGPAIPGGCFLSYLYAVRERWGEGIGAGILKAIWLRPSGGITRAFTFGHTKIMSVRNACTAVTASRPRA